MDADKPAQGKNPLWTRDFTIITLGSVVSMLGATLSSFAMDLMVLDYTGSTLLFAVYNILFMLPHALAPILIGPFLDRFSRKKTIYTLDFITAGMFALLALLLSGSGQHDFRRNQRRLFRRVRQLLSAADQRGELSEGVFRLRNAGNADDGDGAGVDVHL